MHYTLTRNCSFTHHEERINEKSQNARNHIRLHLNQFVLLTTKCYSDFSETRRKKCSYSKRNISRSPEILGEKWSQFSNPDILVSRRNADVIHRSFSLPLTRPSRVRDNSQTYWIIPAASRARAILNKLGNSR